MAWSSSVRPLRGPANPATPRRRGRSEDRRPGAQVVVGPVQGLAAVLATNHRRRRLPRDHTYIHNTAIGSHGCVNLLPADAKKLWNTIGQRHDREAVRSPPRDLVDRFVLEDRRRDAVQREGVQHLAALVLGPQIAARPSTPAGPAATRPRRGRRRSRPRPGPAPAAPAAGSPAPRVWAGAVEGPLGRTGHRGARGPPGPPRRRGGSARDDPGQAGRGQPQGGADRRSAGTRAGPGWRRAAPSAGVSTAAPVASSGTGA